MYPRPFSYVRARDAGDAIRRLAEHGEEASLLAGGMSLVPMMKYRQRSPRVLVDIGRLDELAGIAMDGKVLRIGATTRHYEAASWVGAEALGMVRELAARIGDPQVRNMGTVGGGLAAVEPTGDWGTALIAMRGQVVAASELGERVITSDDLFVGTQHSRLHPDELLTELRLPLPQRQYGTAFAKFEKRAAAAPLISCAASVELAGDGRIARVGLGCVGLDGFPVRLQGVEDVLTGGPPDTDLVEGAVEAARMGVGGFRGSVLGSVVREVLQRATERAQVAVEMPA